MQQSLQYKTKLRQNKKTVSHIAMPILTLIYMG